MNPRTVRSACPVPAPGWSGFLGRELALAALGLGCLAVACSGGDSGGADPANERPANGSAAQQVPARPGGGVPGASALAWTTPSGWTQQTPSSAMRKAQFEVPGSAGTAELVVFYFGPNQGGDALSNAERWAKQFKNPDGSPALGNMTTEEREFGGMATLLTEVGGVYTNTMVSQESFPDYALLGAIVEGPDAPWFFKLTGPKSTIEENREKFIKFLDSLQKAS